MKLYCPISSISIDMSSITDIINNLTSFFNTKNMPFVIGGEYAIQQLCHMFSINYNYEVNSLDIFYLANTPITNEYIFEFRRCQSSPHNSMSYMNADGFQINITLCRSNSMRYISNNTFKFMHPARIMTYYNDDVNRNLNKIFTLEELNDRTQTHQTNYIHCNNSQPEETTSIEPLARRLFVS